MSTSKWKKQIAVTVVIMALGACASQPPVPANNYYRLNPKPAGTAMATPVLDGTVEVSRFVADGSVAARPLLYSSPESPNSVSEYSYHFWSETPPVLLKGALVSYLRAANAAQRVVTPEARIDSDYEVVGQIKRLEVVTGSPYKGVVSLEMGLRHAKSNELIILNDYEAAVNADANTVGAAVTAVEKAMEEVFARFVADFKTP